MPTSAPAERRTDGAQTLERGLRALRLLGAAPGGLTATEVATELGVHRSVAGRLLASLVRTGFAARGESARYRVGAELVALGARVRPDLREAANPVLRELVDRHDATACLLVRDGDHAVAISVIQPLTDGPHLAYRIGSRDRLDRGAGSLAVLAAAPPRLDEPSRVTQARHCGYVRSSGEVTPGTHGIAAPIITDHPDGPACVTLITHRRDTAEAAVDSVVAAAGRIAALLTAAP